MTSAQRWIVWWTDGVGTYYSGGPSEGPDVRVIVQSNRDNAWPYDDYAAARAVAQHIGSADQLNDEDVHVDPTD
jgi:hypothetical protein